MVLLILVSGGATVHYWLFDSDSVDDALSSIVGVTHMAELSLSSSYYEPRVATMHTPTQISYPEMPPIDRMDFVYAK